MILLDQHPLLRWRPKLTYNYLSYNFPITLLGVNGLQNMKLGRDMLLCRGASVAACADLTNQLQCCWVDPACVWKKTLSQQL